ncbi:bifunctional UDP-N-acetylglucosamine diphosphorylase/glucosamine-1-phosphate N-acetyltransferase GlmU [Ammoniphilus sp. CFH 90114]|uniref:bifunctional UDP-N-acetylglucosamine diphosphorylase/glucosamine-1-phosphate N-acetyltransferase GlmU n=1 Tax=Ammoniphilus sp. CFH 90114 TaxID=2493665 RepID=UPI00100F65E7|nr:bifunctional UDP-N-acetylglucosamine diphosphorylase/glucosamine-1-phosphate N-acetyltransferase GlmU [Ammoniphilus sp. CFH 90114]RXT09002.1 bifunctional UDP-N-acetylglucosamine diphosphorylase/glucosamine-1-phosphate N-acetyltransferase GlmU [Ammoniphilus sp. CFH 90114]
MHHKYAVVLAAGQGTRMKSKLYKVLHPVCGKPMVQHIVDRLQALAIDEIVVIVGHGADKVKQQLGSNIHYAFQEKQLGTAHAVMMSEGLLKDKQGTTLVVTGDTPLIKKETLQQLMSHHAATQAAATVLTTVLADATGYGRIVRGEQGHVERIVEHKDTNEDERQIKEISTGIFCFNNELLFKALSQVNNDNVQGEYYLPDVIGILKKQGETISAFLTEDAEDGMGVNDRVQLSQAEQIMRRRINEAHMRNGVSIIDPSSTYIEDDVVIGADTVIQPGTFLRGKTLIGEDCLIGPNADLTNTEVESGVTVQYSVISDSMIRREASVGPFAYIRPGSDVGEQVKVGDFVELKNTRLGNFSKVSHLSYLGDAEVGEGVNVGCGTVTVNYDGVNKHKTIIGDRSFIGCNSNLVAPVTIGEGAYVAAGSTVTKDVPEGALAVARERQSNKEGYASKWLRKEK